MQIDRRAVMDAVTHASDRYEAALQANDLVVLDELFWHDERVERIAAGDELRGIEAIRAYRAVRPTGDAARERLSRHIVCFGDAAAVVNILFRRARDGRIGRQSQTWVHLAGAWRIVSAHISFRET